MIRIFDIEKEWEIVRYETITKAPKHPLSEPLVNTRGLLIEAQVLLARISFEKTEKVKAQLINDYFFVMDMYFRNLNGSLN